MSRLPDSSTHLPPARRTMADITALFMTGAGPAPQRPQRTPPQPASLPPVLAPHRAVARHMEGRDLTPGVRETGGATVGTNGSPLIVKDSSLHFGAGILDSMAKAKPAGAAEFLEKPVILSAPPAGKEVEQLPLVQAALLDHSTTGGYRDLLETAKLLAGQHGVAIGIIGRDECVLRMARVDGGTRQGHVVTHIEAKKGPADLQLARQLFALRQTVGHWIIAVPRLDLSRKMLEVVPDWLLISATDNDAVIACYRMLKGVCTLPGAREATIRLMPRTADKMAAIRTFARLNHAAHEFLQQELKLLTPPPGASSRVEPIAEYAVVDHDGDDTEAAWTAVLEFVHDLQDVDLEETPGSPDVVVIGGSAGVPDEKTILAASVLEASENEALLRPMVAAIAEETRAAVGEPAKPAGASAQRELALRVCDETTDLYQLKEALSDLLPGAIFLEARSPMNTPSLLAADADGTLHVWMMADSADLTSWGSMWQWASEHRQLIGLTRPDLRLGTHSHVKMHLILPPDAPRAIRTPLPGVLYYRLHILRWGGRTATAVIPLG